MDRAQLGLPYNWQRVKTWLQYTGNVIVGAEKKIKISILQGSILGPILFLCYINDLYRVTDLFTLMFADDTFSAKSDNDLNRLIDYVNVEINKMAIWFRANKLAVNKGKTKYIIFRTRGKQLPINIHDLVFNENEVGSPFNPD